MAGLDLGEGVRAVVGKVRYCPRNGFGGRMVGGRFQGSDTADFDRMAPRKADDYLCISEEFHKTFLALDERGTEAAAATAVAMVRLPV